jgi:carbonic anhydrase/acetyltransferase-like protein (isoleucine patch superfamily)
MRLKGGRLELEADSVPDFRQLPKLDIVVMGAGDGVLRLRFGRGVRLGDDIKLEVWARGSNLLELGDFSLIHGCILQLRGGSIRTADHAQIRDHSVIKAYGKLWLGSRSIISYSSAVHCEESVVIEDLVGMAERVTVVDSDKMLSGGDDFFNDRPSRVEGVTVGRNTYVGAGAVITRGARIGKNCAIAANAVVNRGDHPSGWLLGGVPAKPIKALGEPAGPSRDTPSAPSRPA